MQHYNKTSEFEAASSEMTRIKKRKDMDKIWVLYDLRTTDRIILQVGHMLVVV